MKKLLILIFLFQFNLLNAQKTNSETIAEKNKNLKSNLYKGKLNGSIKIWLYLNEQEHPCGGEMTVLNAMYKYDNQDKWILLNVTVDKQKKKYCLVEDNFTGAMFLEENGNYFNGHWISPDAKKQFKVILERLKLDETSTIEQLEEILFDDLLYNKNDC
jgi:hypothetical protein